MAYFRQRPLVVEAVQLSEAQQEYPDWFVNACKSGVLDATAITGPAQLFVRTPQGDLKADVGDWIVLGAGGWIAPYKPDVFAEMFEAAGGR